MDTNVFVPDLYTYINVVGDSILLSTVILAYICKLKIYLLIYNTFITRYLIFIIQVIV